MHLPPTSLLSAFILALGVLLCSASAAAQSRDYQALVEEGISEFQLGHWNESRALFEEAHALRPSARTHRGLGMVEFELRHYVKSVGHLVDALANHEDALPPALASETEALLVRARTFVARYVLQLSPADASVSIDGMEARPEPDGALLLDAGEHRLLVSAEGHRDHEVKLDAVGGSDTALQISLKPLDDALAPAAIARAARPEPGAPGVATPADDTATEADESGLLGQWWFWTAAGVVVAAIVVGTVVASGAEDQIGPATETNSGVVVMALEGM